MGTVPTPYAWIAGDDATQPRMISLTDAINFLLGNTTSGGSKRPAALLRATTGQTIANGAVYAAVAWDTEDLDNDNSHSTVTNTSRFTAQTTGWHTTATTTPWAGTASGSRYLRLRVNSADINNAGNAVGASTAAPTGPAATRKVFLNAGDFLEVFTAQDSATNPLALSTGAIGPQLSVTWDHV